MLRERVRVRVVEVDVELMLICVTDPELDVCVWLVKCIECGLS